MPDLIVQLKQSFKAVVERLNRFAASSIDPAKPPTLKSSSTRFSKAVVELTFTGGTPRM